MRPLNTALLVFIIVTAGAAQSADPLLLDTRSTRRWPGSGNRIPRALRRLT